MSPARTSIARMHRPPRAARRLLPGALSCLLGALFLLGGPAAASAQPVQVVDDSGHTVALARPAQRVVALGPHLTEQLFAIGAGPQVVGVSRFSDYPAAARALPVVGDAVALHLEQIARLKPDLVVVWRSGFPDRARAPLAALGVPVYDSEIRSMAQLGATLRRLGVLMGRAAEAEAEAARIDTEWQALQAAYSGRPPVRVFYQLWPQPLMTLNREHLIHQAITACGGVNVFAELPALTPTVSWEAAVQRNPQVIAMAGAPSDHPERGLWPRFPEVEAVRAGRFALIPGDLIGRMGPRFVQGARSLCVAIDAAR